MAKFAATRAPKSLYLLALTAALHLACADFCRGDTGENPLPARLETASSADHPKRVLLLFGEDQTFPVVGKLGQSIRSTLNNRSASRIEFYAEYLDRTRINDSVYESELVSFWRTKYEGHKFDLIIVCIASALDLLSKHRSDFFPGAPIVYCVLFEEDLSRINLPPGATGVWSAKPFRPTLEQALRLHPGARRVVVVSGSSPFDKEVLEVSKPELRDFENEVAIDYLTDVTIAEVQARLASLPPHTIVLYEALSKDSAGVVFTSPEVLSRIAPTSAAPIYGVASTLLGSGIVGGSLIDFELLGASAAESGARILAGDRPEDIAPHGVPNVVAFDWRELQRWRISEKDLPPGSRLDFRQQSFFEQYRLHIAVAVTLLILETLLIAGLWVNRARRLKAEKENAGLARLAERQHRRLEEFVANVPGIVWETRIEPGGSARKLEFLSSYAQAMLGYSLEEFYRPHFWLSVIHEEDREQAARDLNEVWALGNERNIQFRCIAKDGRVLWTETYLAGIVDEKGERVGLRGVTIDVTDRKMAEQAARESEETTGDILRALPDLMFLQTPDGVFLKYHANDKSNLLVPSANFLGKNMRDVLPPKLVEDLLPLFRSAQETREPQVLEYMLPAAGEARWFEARIVSSGENILSVVRDITDRRRAEEALTENRMQLSGIIHSAMDAIISIDEDHRIVLMNPAAEQIFRFPAGEAIGQPIDLLIPEWLREVQQGHIRRFGETNVTQRSIGTLRTLDGRRADGEEFPIEASISQVELNERKFYTAILRDITSRTRALEAIKESEANYRFIFNAVNDAIFVHDSETGEIVDANRAMCEMYGVTPAEARTLGLEVLSSNEPPYSQREALRWIQKAVEGEPQVFDWRARDKKGRLFWVEVSLRRSVIGGKDRVLAVVRDITYRKQADEALRESEERFRTMADTAPVMIWISGPDGLRTYFNQQWLDFTGQTMEETSDDRWADAVHPEDLERCLSRYNTHFDRREHFTMEYRLRRADGNFRWVYDSGAPRLSTSGKFLGYIGSCIDITDRRAAEQALADLSGQLIRARENECARIARELHDDLNQRMALVSVELEQLGQDPPATHDKLRGRLREILNQVADISREIHRMSYDLHPSKLVHLGLVAAVSSLCKELSKSQGLKIEFTHAEVPATLPQDMSLCLYRIVQECLNNVIRHSGAQTARVELRGNGKEIRLRVSDTGRGFDAKSPRVRKGLGLLSMRERLRLIDGTISIESRPLLGTQIEARVPLERIARGKDGLSPTDRMRAAG